MMIVAYILITLGLIGAISVWSSIVNEINCYTYTYTPPYTDHETSLMIALFIFAIMAGSGVAMIIFSIMKKRNEDKLNKVLSYSSNGTIKNVCPNCGVNISEETTICPKCGTQIEKE